MFLKLISTNEDKSNPAFVSADCQQLLKMYDDYYPEIGFNMPWVGYFVIHNDKIVGSCGFTGAPRDGKVEVAYWTFKEYEGMGIASFACRQLVAIARRADPGLVITAKTAPEHNASTKILLKNNFIHSGMVQDHEIGDAWLWIFKEPAG